MTGVDQDLRPVFSEDGTHVVFERSRGANLGRLMVARSDGTGLVAVTPKALSRLRHVPAAAAQYTFSPDGTEIAVWSTPDTGGKLWIVQSDGTGVRQLDVPMTVVGASYLPPNGNELIVTAGTNGGPNGIYAIDPKTGAQLTTIVGPDPASGLDYVRLSPDGSRLAYVERDGRRSIRPSSYRVHVVDLDGSNDITLPLPGQARCSRTPPPGRTMGRSWRSRAAMPRTTRTWRSPSFLRRERHRHRILARAHRLLRHAPPVVARRHLDPGHCPRSSMARRSSSSSSTRRPPPSCRRRGRRTPLPPGSERFASRPQRPGARRARITAPRCRASPSGRPPAPCRRPRLPSSS